MVYQSPRSGLLQKPWQEPRKTGILVGILFTIATAIATVFIHEYIWAVVLFLLSAVFFYIADAIEVMRGYASQTFTAVEENLGRIIQENLGRIELVQQPEDVFDRARITLAEGPWDEVAIYSPHGLWGKSRSIDRWLKAVGLALSKSKSPVDSFYGVFVLPPTIDDFNSYAAPRLMNFNNCLRGRRCQIHYLPPEDRLDHHPLTAPGMGMAVFAASNR
jgi:hypothetical protein